jgi:hypothetical protein
VPAGYGRADSADWTNDDVRVGMIRSSDVRRWASVSAGRRELPAGLRADHPASGLAIDPREMGVEPCSPVGHDPGVLARAALDQASRTRRVIRDGSRDAIVEVHVRAPRPVALACSYADGSSRPRTPMTGEGANPLQARIGHTPAHVTPDAGGVTCEQQRRVGSPRRRPGPGPREPPVHPRS